MRVLVLNEHDVRELLPMAACIELMQDVLAALSRNEIHNPLRFPVRAEGASGLLGLMPAYRRGDKPLWALKEVCVYPGNPARGLDTHLGAVLLHSGETGELLAIINAAAVTEIRTAAVSAVATRHLARTDASTLAILGSGAQARSHLAAIPLVRNIRNVQIFSRTPAKAESLSRLTPISAEVASTAEEAVRDADVVVTATSSKQPLVKGDWIAAGTHINAVGSSVPSARELDSDLVAAASLFVDRRESTLNESGDYLEAVRERGIGPDHIRAELGEVIAGTVKGRRTEQETTLFKSLGLAAEDLASAAFLFDEATRQSRGVWVEL